MTDGLDFTVIVPTRDRHAQLAGCLESLSALTYPRSRFEVVVIDDGSREPVELAAGGFRERIQLRVQRQAPSGPAAARNLGASLARGRFLAFTDDDCRPAPVWLDALAARLSAAPGAVVGGSVLNQIEENVYSAASQTLIGYLYEYFNRNPARPWFLASCNFALSADGYRAVGGFDLSYPTAAAEDRDICDRLQLHGLRMIYAPDAVVYHRHPLTLAGFWAQHFGYGRGARRYRRAHRERCGSDVRFEPPAFYWNMLAFPTRQRGLRSPLVVSCLLALSQVANVAGFLCEWIGGGTGRIRSEA